MDDIKDEGNELYCHNAVILKHCIAPNKDEDGSSLGILSIVDYANEKFIEWKPIDVSVVSETQDHEWAMVNTVEQRIRTQSGNFDGQYQQYQSRCVRVPVSDIKSFRIIRNKQQLTLTNKDGIIHSTFYFQNSNVECFMDALMRNVKLVRSRKDNNSFLTVSDHDAQALALSFAELKLTPYQSPNPMWKFVKNLQDHPYETTLGAFSKLTDLLLYRPNEQREDVAELLHQSLTADDYTYGSIGSGTDEYELVGNSFSQNPILPPRSPVIRGRPLSPAQWSEFIEIDPALRDVDSVRSIIFSGGVDPSIRFEVWKFLLSYFPWRSTHEEREAIINQRTDDYLRMKQQWKSISAEQEQRFADYRERKSLIEKDVNRTDRTMPYFAGESNPNLQKLSDILMTYVMYNFDLGYVQGMSDLLSPILILFKDEVDSFWCFVGFMDKVFSNFEMDQEGMKQQLQHLHSLLAVADPQLATYLDNHDSGNMFFCFRWLLVLFKRELSLHDVMLLWEVLWTHLPCPNFHLLVCVAILDSEKKTLMGNNYGFTEILKHINDLSQNIDINEALAKAESIYYQLTATVEIPDNVRCIIGLPPLHPNENGADTDDSDIDITKDQQCNGHSLETVTLTSSLGEASYERGLELNYM